MAWILFVIILLIGLLNLLITRTLVRDEGLHRELTKRQQRALEKTAKRDAKEGSR